MKAVILAGGFGTRLMPMTACCPKPMIRIMDKPIIEYGLEQLKKYSITDICITLGYLPAVIENYIKANDSFGMNINCVTECTPCGTAGSVKKCQNFIGNDDFIVISGDAICDFDLAKCIERHRETGSKASIILYSHPEPLEFGLVVTDGDGRVKGFVEKPSWDRVETNLINTGIYIFSHEVLDKIPADKNTDFGKDVFPSLLNDGYPLYGIEAEGYWCDVGSPASYRRCVGDMLDGKTSLPLPASRDCGGASVTPPVYISPKSHIADGAVIGPHTVIGGGSVVGKDARVAGSIIDAATVTEGCDIEGAVMCRASLALPGAKLGEGCIIADETEIGGRAVVMPGVSVWPRQRIEPGQLVTHSIVTGSLKGFPEFTESGVMVGKYNSSLTPEVCFELGAACSTLGRVGAAHGGTPAAAALAASFCGGAVSSGGDVYRMDVKFPAGAAYLGSALGLAVTAFISEHDGDAVISFFDETGRSVSRSAERKLEAVFTSGRRYAPSDGTGVIHDVSGGGAIYAAAAVRSVGVRDAKVKVTVTGSSPESAALREALECIGCETCGVKDGVIVIEPSDGGKNLRVWDENGKALTREQVTCIIAADELKRGKTVAVPLTAPRAVDEVGRDAEGRLLRVGRDDGAEEIYLASPWQWDGIFSAVKLVAIMARSGVTLSELAGGVPDFAVASREIRINASRGEIMRRLSEMTEFARDDGPGLRFDSDTGFARVRPASDSEALNVTAECRSAEAADELCGTLKDMIEGK